MKIDGTYTITLVSLLRKQALLSKQGGNAQIFPKRPGSNKSEQGGKRHIFFIEMIREQGENF